MVAFTFEYFLFIVKDGKRKGLLVTFEGLDLFADTHKLDWLARHRLHREGSSSPRVTVELCEDRPGDSDNVIEGLREVSSLLSRHGIDDKQDLVGLHDVLDILKLRHEVLINNLPARSVDNHGIKSIFLGVLKGLASNRPGILLGALLEHLAADLASEGLELLDGGGAVDVASDEQHLAGRVLLLAVEGKLGSRSRLTRTLQTSHKDLCDAAIDAGERGLLASEDAGELVVHDLDKLLCRVHSVDNGGADSLLLDLLDDAVCDGEINIGLEERAADVLERSRDAVLCDCLLASELLDGPSMLLES